jgi:hypothetical protein
MTNAIDVLKAELSKASHKIDKLMKWEILGSQHRAELNDKAGRWVVLYVLVVEYDFCKRKWRFFAHQMQLHPPNVKDGAAFSFEDAKAKAESILKGWCTARTTPPDLKKLTPWRPLPRDFRI